jgi:ribosome-associated protein
MSMIRVNRAISIDESELTFEFVRSSGPGGQNVNKVATAARLRFDVMRSRSLPLEVRERLLRIAGRRVGGDGILTIRAQRQRTQEGNRREATLRLVELVRRAAVRRRPRRATKPTAASRRKRLETKRLRSRTKAGRRGVSGVED